MPGFTAYALGGVDAVLSGGVDPYVGVGVGWDHNIFAPIGGKTGEGKSQSGGSGWSGSGLGGLGNGLAYIVIPLVAVAVAVVAVIGFICAGRVEFRYHAGSSRNALPLSAPVPTVSVLLGYGI